MEFWKNLENVLEEKDLSHYKAANKCGLSSQAIDNIIKTHVKKPKPDTLKQLAEGLGVSENRLLYGVDTFDPTTINRILEEKHIDIETFAIETGLIPSDIDGSKIPPLEKQENAAEFLGVPKEILFGNRLHDLSRQLKAEKIKPYQRPDLKSDPNTVKDMIAIYEKLSPTAKRIVYNLALDFWMLEEDNIITITPKQSKKNQEIES